MTVSQVLIPLFLLIGSKDEEGGDAQMDITKPTELI